MATDWKSTWLHKIDQWGGQEPFGSGPYGRTEWNDTALNASAWKSTYLHAIDTWGGQEPFGSGPYGKTIWTEDV